MGPLRGTVGVGALGAALLTAGSFSIGARADLAGPAPAAGWWPLVSGSGQVAGLVLVWCGVALLTGAWLADLGPARRGELSTADLRLRLLAWSLPLLPALPVFSADSWSYLAQGQMLLGTHDPYVDGPGAAGGSFAAFVHADWRYTPTPYGPLQLGLTHLLATATADAPWLGIVGLRLLTCAALALGAWALAALARQFGTDAGFALWLGMANPLVLVHLVCGLHNDALALALVLAALVPALRAARPGLSPSRVSGLLLASGLVFGAAVAVKVTAVIAMPFAVWFAGRRPVGAAGRGLVLTAGTATSLVVLSVATTGGFGWFGALSVSDRVVTWLALPTAVAHLLAAAGAGSFEDLVVVCRAGGRVLLAALLVVAWWLGRPRRPEPAAAGDDDLGSRQRAWRHTCAWMAAGFAALFLLNSVSWPWYWVFVLALLPLVRWHPLLPAGAAAGIVFQMLTTGPNGSTTLYTPVQAVLAVIACAVTFWLVARATGRSGTERPEARRPSPARGA